MSAILLPFSAPGKVDWDSFGNHLRRTWQAGLVPAVNMDTGYANLIDDATRRQVLHTTQAILMAEFETSEFIAGAFVADQPGANFDYDGYRKQIDQIESHGGLPIIFQSYGLNAGEDDQVLQRYQQLAETCERFIAFELGQMFAPFGKIYSLDLYRELIQIEACIGAKHSSLNRNLEWQRLGIRNQMRPDFRVLTGNDLAIDMVMYGSDYLLGLSTFCPELFALRDQFWLDGNVDFFQLNDELQYLGCFAFREPTSAYKHSAAMFLKQRGWLTTDLTHPQSPQRPDSDREILSKIQRRLELYSVDRPVPAS